MPKEKFEDRLKMLRGDIPQADFAKVYGLSKNTLWGYENGTSIPKISFLKRLAEDFGVTTDWLLFGDKGAPKPALTARESALLANYRASPEEGRRSLETTSALLAQSKKKMKKAE